MDLILDFQTSTTIEEHFQDTMQWIEKCRLKKRMGFNKIQLHAAELGAGVNYATLAKKQRMTSKTLTVLGQPHLLQFDFSIQTQDNITITNSAYPNWEVMFLEHLKRKFEASKQTKTQFAENIGITPAAFIRWEKAKNMRIEKLFGCLKFLEYRMIFTNKI